MIIEQLTFFPHLAKTVTVTPNGYGKVICEEFPEKISKLTKTDTV